MLNRAFTTVCMCITGAMFLVTPALGDPRSDYIAALTSKSAAEGDLRAATQELASARAARERAEREAADETRRATVELAKRLTELRSRTPVAPKERERPARIVLIEENLRTLATTLERAKAVLLGHVSKREAAKKELERRQASLNEAVQRFESDRVRESAATATLGRLSAPEAARTPHIVRRARSLTRVALQDHEASKQLARRVRGLLNSSSVFRSQSTEAGRASFANVPAGHVLLVTNATLEALADSWEDLRKVKLHQFSLGKSGYFVLAREDAVPFNEIVEQPSEPTVDREFDECVLLSLPGANSDVAARALIHSCRTLHPESARHDVTVRFPKISRLDEVHLFSSQAINGLLNAARVFSKAAKRLHLTKIDIALQEARDQKAALFERARRASTESLRRKQALEKLLAAALEALHSARAKETEARNELYRVETSDRIGSLRTELASLVGAWEREEASARHAAKKENERRAKEVAQVERALVAAREVRAKGDAGKLRPVRAREATAVARVAALQKTSATAVNVVGSKRAAYLRSLAQMQLRKQFIANLRLDLRYSEQICIRFRNDGPYSITEPSMQLLFKGKTLESMGIKSGNLILMGYRGWLKNVKYKNRFNETIFGMKPQSSTKEDCQFFQNTEGDNARSFEKFGGSVRAWRNPSSWSVKTYAKLSDPQDLREVKEKYSNERKWKHAATPLAQLFARELASAVKEATGRSPTALEGSEVVPVRPANATSGASASTEPTFALNRTKAAAVQEKLKSLGLYKGRIDGIPGRRTEASIIAWQRSQGLPGTGKLTRTQLTRLLRQTF